MAYSKMAGRELTMGEAMEIAELEWYLSSDDGPGGGRCPGLRARVEAKLREYGRCLCRECPCKSPVGTSRRHSQGGVLEAAQGSWIPGCSAGQERGSGVTG
jgi:hypothetical protein